MVSLLVNDPIHAFKFYTEKLGFIERLYMPEHYVAIVASPEEPNGTGLLLEPSDNPISKPFQEAVYAQGLPLIVFGVEDCQKSYEELKARGVEFRQEPTKTDYGTVALLEDTCGNLIQIHQV
jgi:predicted enzyme related to lactoylglutathione lyase